jgi:hypothetical protein
MVQIIAHITEFELPGFLLAAVVGFTVGVVVTLAVLARKMK